MEKVIEEQKEIFQDNYLATVTQNDLAKMNLIALKKEMISLAKQLLILHIRRRQP